MKQALTISVVIIVLAGCVTLGPAAPLVWSCGSEPYIELNNAREIFSLPHGISEFDLHYHHGEYHLWHQDRRVDDARWTQYRSASTLAGLRTANPTDIQGSYPAALHDGGTWHLWLWDHTNHVTRHHESTAPSGPWVERGALPVGWADWHVRRSPYDGRYYGVYKHLNTRFAGAAVADSPEGPWVDLGWIVDDNQRLPWHEFEDADPSIYYVEGRTFVYFAGWDGAWQRVGVVEVDPFTMRATGEARILVEPTQRWQQRHGVCKVFSPIALNGHLYFAHNPSDDGLASGWGRIPVR